MARKVELYHLVKWWPLLLANIGSHFGYLFRKIRSFEFYALLSRERSIFKMRTKFSFCISKNSIKNKDFKPKFHACDLGNDRCLMTFNQGIISSVFSFSMQIGIFDLCKPCHRFTKEEASTFFPEIIRNFRDILLTILKKAFREDNQLREFVSFIACSEQLSDDRLIQVISDRWGRCRVWIIVIKQNTEIIYFPI